MKRRLPLPQIALGLFLGVFAAGPALAYEYGWIVSGSGPRTGDAQVATASRSVGIGVWKSIASTPAYRPEAGGGPWRNLVAHSIRPTPGPSPKASAPASKP